jgi:hypothetical protein
MYKLSYLIYGLLKNNLIGLYSFVFLKGIQWILFCTFFIQIAIYQNAQEDGLINNMTSAALTAFNLTLCGYHIFEFLLFMILCCRSKSFEHAVESELSMKVFSLFFGFRHVLGSIMMGLMISSCIILVF